MNNFATQLAVFAAALVATSAAAADTDWSKVDQALGRKGADQPGGVHKFSFPRSDLKVVVDGVELKPALALGSWVAFQPAGSDAMCMGDLVLTETEISAVMKRLVDDGIEISAVHNHLLRTSQPVVYMHIAGHGEPAKLADTIHAALALSKTPLTQSPPAPAASPVFDTASLDAALGFKGTVNGEVYQFSIPRAEAISEGGMSIPPSMGTAIGINFQATSAGKVATTGDFVLLGKEVNPVVKALRDHGIEVTALHSHMIDDSPHLYFMHFWANDEVKKVAQGLRAALDLANIKHGS
jgi:biotin operon repressor